MSTSAFCITACICGCAERGAGEVSALTLSQTSPSPRSTSAPSTCARRLFLLAPQLTRDARQLYPESWGESGNSSAFGTQWITDHATAMKSANKPVIMEEFGVTTSQLATYTTWYSTVISSGLTGDLIWCVLQRVPGRGSPADGHIQASGFNVQRAADAKRRLCGTGSAGRSTRK
jgi:hypothetical protein